jgi:hypothetical protein
LDFVAILGLVPDSDTYDADMGVWLHENKIEFLNAKHAMEKYKQYKELYEEEDKSIYRSDFSMVNEDIDKKPIDFEYLRKYLEAWGLDPDETLKKLKKSGQCLSLFD